jgi:DNA-binding SARP family transcriptional activator
MGRFDLWRDGRPVTFACKVPRKPLALLKTLIAMGAPDSVGDERLIDLLWPDAEGNAGGLALTTTVYQLRRLLGHRGRASTRPEGQC